MLDTTDQLRELAVGEHHGDGNDEDADDNPREHGFSPELEVVCSNTDAPTSELDLISRGKRESKVDNANESNHGGHDCNERVGYKCVPSPSVNSSQTENRDVFDDALHGKATERRSPEEQRLK
jgi:hypothetical protein